MAVTRPAHKVAAAREALESRGFRVIAAPMLQLHPHDDPAYGEVLDGLAAGRLTHAVFTSTTGVRHAIERAEALRGEGALARLLHEGGATVVAIGPLTADALRREGLPVHAVPDVYSSSGILRWFEGEDGLRVAVVRSTRGSPELTDGLEAMGAHVVEAHVYHVDRPSGDAADRLFDAAAAGAVDAYTFTSSLTARHLLELAGERGVEAAVRGSLEEAVVAAIGAPTRDTLHGLGVKVDLVPPDATFESLADALARRRDGGASPE